jgi:uncharacterized protein YqgC (DUF456 family)
MNVDLLLWVAVVILAAAGIAGTVFPLLPGPILLFAGLLLGAWIDDFAYVGVGTLVSLGVLAALAYLFDAFGTAIGAKRYGASRWAIAGATIGGVLGLFFGLIGVVLGPFIGAVIGELSFRRDIGTAARAGWGATLGIALAAAGKLALGFVMIGLFLVMRFL